jgi:hypothetical protein
LVLSPGVVQAVPYPPDSLTAYYQAAATYINGQTTPSGYCVVFGAGEGRLAYELSLLDTNRRFLGIEDASASVDSGRTKLEGDGLYGYNIRLHNGSLTAGPYADYAGALILCDTVIAEGSLPGSASEMFRLVRPAGGVAIIGQPPNCPNAMSQSALESWLGGLSYTITNDSNGIWARIDRAALTGAGDWDHMWGNIGNTACSEDTLSGDTGNVQWWGEPGPRFLINRHDRPMASLVKAGRLVVPGIDDIYCVDAYNGAVLWTLSNTGWGRMAMVRDAGCIALADDYAYIANDDGCKKVDMDTGTVADTYPVPTSGRDWGYVGVTGDYLIGSEQIAGASINSSELDVTTYANSYFGFNEVTTSKQVFCYNRNTGAEIWTYDNSSVIANPTICAGDGYVYFIESRDSSAVNDSDGRVHLDDAFLNGNNEYIVKVDITNGNVAWAVQRNIIGPHVLYLSYKDDVVLVASCGGRNSATYYHYAYDSSDCSLLWSDNIRAGGSVKGDHGEQDKHSMIIGSVVYNKHASYDLNTGNTAGRTWGSSNCADYSSSANYIYTRDGGRAYAYGKTSGGNYICTEMRTGCYISIIPAGGLTILPPYSTGCTCGTYTLQTTVAWRP